MRGANSNMIAAGADVMRQIGLKANPQHLVMIWEAMEAAAPDRVIAPTPRQAELLQFIREFLDKNGCSPTYAEMKDGLNFKSTNQPARLVEGLEKRGLIYRLPSTSRGIRIIENV